MSKALVERLNAAEIALRDDRPYAAVAIGEAADRIGALEAERNKQREHIRAQAEDIMTLGHLVYDDADPPATWKMRALAAEADKARLSEALAGLCEWIENEVGAELPFDARAALSDEVTR